MLKKIFLLFLAAGLFAAAGHAQETKEDIQKRQQELQKELDDLNNTLAQIKKNKKQSLSQLAVVQRKIRLREEMVVNLNKDLKRLDKDIDSSSNEIGHLKTQLDTLKSNYAKSIAFAYKNRSNYDYLNFLFSAASFNDAVKRLAYLRSYRHNREVQAGNIVRTEQLMEQKVVALTNTKNDKNRVLGEQSKQLLVLNDDKKQKDDVVAQLKTQEADVSEQIRSNEKNRIKMKNLLTQVIRREQQRLAEEAKRKEQERQRQEAARQASANANKPANNNNPSVKADNRAISPNRGDAATANIPGSSNRAYNVFETTPEWLTQSINFEAGRGNLPWPVNSGIISMHFGLNQIGNLKTMNDGITIALPVGATVKAVADGEVSVISDMGNTSVVIVRHGKYFTSYSNLATVSVNKGDQVKAGKVLGTAAADETGEGQLQFDVSNDKSNFFDPEKWLRRR